MTSPSPLRDYQIADLSFLIAEGKALMLHDPGGGKTPTVCVWFWYHWAHNQHRTCWVMPKSLTDKNRDELLKFTHFVPSDIQIVDKADDLQSDAKVFLMTPTRFRMSWGEMISLHPDIQVLAADEPHMYWTTNDTQVTQALYRMMRRTKFFVGMTGTLIKGRLNSCYPMFHVIEPRYYPSYQAFMNYHAIMDAYNNVIAWKNPDRIAEIVGRHAIKRSFASIYGPEAKVIQTQTCLMAPKQLAAYKEFEAKAIIELDNEFLDAPTGGVFALRCRQIMAHPETFGLAKGEPTGKDDVLAIHMADHKNTGKPCLVFAAFIPEQERIAKMIQAAGMTVGLMNGNTTAKQRITIDHGYQAGNIQWIVGSPRVAAVGYNWQDTALGETEHVVYTTLDYGDDAFVQSYRRAVRGVRKTPLLINVLEYKASIDQKVFSIIQRKSALANAVDGDKEVYALSA